MITARGRAAIAIVWVLAVLAILAATRGYYVAGDLRGGH